MKQCLRLLVLGLLLTLGPTASAQVAADKTLPTFTAADGLEVSLWASEPLLTNPTCIDIDHRGRVWVCESVNYRHKLRKRPPVRPEGDRILILEDSQATGRADKVTTFYQAPDFLAPLGIAVAKDPSGPGYKVYVCHSPDILRFEDKNGDGKADGPPRKLLTGFRGYDHDHGVHGVLIGPDGKLYFSVGDQGVTGLVDKNGKIWTSNQTDCRAGTNWRCDLDGKNLEFLAHNFRNQYEPCVDSFGTVFVSDNDDDGNQQTRICYVMPGGNYGYHPRGPGQSHWHEEQPGVVPKILRTYFGSPTGMCVYEGTLLPEKYRGQVLHTDAGPRQLRCYHLRPEGAGYAVDQEEVATSSDNWFRPSDVCVAPDGSVFIADWYDPGVGGHGMGDTTRGRIYRVAPKGHRSSVPTIDLGSGGKGLLTALASPALSVRYLAQATFERERGRTRTEHVVDLLGPAATQKEDPVLRARALWQLGVECKARKGTWEGAPTSSSDATSARLAYEKARDSFVAAHALGDPDARFRVLAIRVLRDFFERTPLDYADQVLQDPSPAVRREALLALRDQDATKSKALILELAKRYDGKDHLYLAAIGIAVGQEKARRDVILADFQHQFPVWDDRVVDLVWELRPPQVMPQLEQRLADATLPTAQRSRIVDIIASADDPGAAKVLLQSLAADAPPDVSARIVENLKLFLPGKWRNLRQSPDLAAAISWLLERRSGRATALALIGAAERTEAAGEVAALARDPAQPLEVRQPAVQTLGLLASPEAVNALESLLTAEPAALRVEVVQALGNHLQNRTQRPTSEKALQLLQKLVAAADQDVTLRQAAAMALADSRPGTIWLLDAHSRAQLPDALKPDIGRLLRNSPYQDLRNRALIAFPPPRRLDPLKLPTVAALLARKGDAARGQQLLAASLKNDMQCLKCHGTRGAGGNVGPDLAAIGSKASRENLIESILAPNKAIADQYVTWVIETKQGLALTGLLVEETPDHLTLRDANARDVKIAKQDIQTRAKSPTSLMPSDLLAYMTEEDVVDMVEYLLTLKSEK
jgi:putative membrane-bound dehydrogenase-like protein